MRFYDFKLLVYITQRAIVVENRPKVCPFMNPGSNVHIFYVEILHLVASSGWWGFGCKGMVEEAHGVMKLCEQLKERETLRKVSEANHWFQSQMKDYQREVEECRIAKEELATQVKESEKKQKTLEAELIQLQEDLALSERARKSAESERDELHEEINNSTSKGEKQNIAKSSRKLEKRVKELLLQLDDERRHADQYKEQYLEKEGVSVTLEDIGKQTMPDGSILPLPPILLGTSGNDPKKKIVYIYGHLDVQPAALYCAQIWLGKYDSKSGEADFLTPDKRREFMRLKYEEKKFYVDPREAIKKMKPPGPVALTSASPSVSQSKSHTVMPNKDSSLLQNLLFLNSLEHSPIKIVGFACRMPLNNQQRMNSLCFTLTYAAPEVVSRQNSEDTDYS